VLPDVSRARFADGAIDVLLRFVGAVDVLLRFAPAGPLPLTSLLPWDAQQATHLASLPLLLCLFENCVSGLASPHAAHAMARTPPTAPSIFLIQHDCQSREAEAWCRLLTVNRGR